MMTAKRRTTKPKDGKTPAGAPASQRVTCPPCQACRSDNTRFASSPRSDSEFRVRYCKCYRCGWTWTDVQRQPWLAPRGE